MEGAVFAGQSIEQGAIGKVIHVTGFGPTIDADDYESRLAELTEHSRYVREIHNGREEDMSHSCSTMLLNVDD